MKDLTEYTAAVLGLHGMERAFKIAHLPFLTVNDTCGVIAFEGSSGTGKTTLVNRLGKLNEKVTGGRVGIYSADKVRYDDFIGIPVPEKDIKGVEIYSMPNAIADMETVLIDEVNRASYDNQEKFLSLIASRVIDGIPVSCKYLYVAMNPVMSEAHDMYEGVQPLDKAFGERVMAVVSMKSFHEMSKEQQLQIMTSTFNQVSWEPSQEDVDLHVRFVAEARKRYEDAKEKHLKNVCEYIHKVQRDLAEYTNRAITIEGRRAQFLLVNILSLYAINSIYTTKANIESSALEALEMSFPHRLWEMNIEFTQLERAHDNAKELLTFDEEKFLSSPSNVEGVLRPIAEIREAVKNASSKTDLSREALSRLVNQNLPSVDNDPINHYCYALAFRDGLSQAANSINSATSGKLPQDGQTTLKKNEFARLSRIADKVTDTKEFENIKNASMELAQNKGRDFPSGFSYPFYTDPDLDSSGIELFKRTIVYEIGWYTHTIMSQNKELARNMHDYTEIIEKLTTAITEVMEMAIEYDKLQD